MFLFSQVYLTTASTMTRETMTMMIAVVVTITTIVVTIHILVAATAVATVMRAVISDAASITTTLRMMASRAMMSSHSHTEQALSSHIIAGLP